MTPNVRWAAGVCVALCAAGVFTQLVAAPVREVQGNVTVVHGGVGADERAAVEALAAEHNLRLTFARKGSGAYLAGVKVVVRNRQGAVVIDTVASGPLMLATLPDGEYTVSATERDSTLTQVISIKGGTRRAWVFRFELPQGVEPEMDAGK